MIANALRYGQQIRSFPVPVGIAMPIEEFPSDDTELATLFALWKSLGITWVRTGLTWSVAEPSTQGVYNWSALERIVLACNAVGMKVLVVTKGIPDWAQAQPGHFPHEDPADYGAFMAAAVAHFRPFGVRHFELWNEPNLNSFLPGMDDVLYANSLVAAYTAMKAVDPGCFILSAGLAPAPDSTATATAAVNFMTTIYSIAGVYFDGVAFHPYSRPLLPSDTQSWNGWQIMVNGIRDLMTAPENGDSAKKIWPTEFGSPTGGSGTFDEVDNAQAALILEDAFSIIQTTDYLQAPIFLYSWQDRDSDDITSAENHFGLRYSTGLWKPELYDALYR